MRLSEFEQRKLDERSGLEMDRRAERQRLNAAAPDMLRALKWAEAALAPFSQDPAEKSGINMVRAAIAKAKL